MLARDYQAQFESQGKRIVDKYHDARESWIDFCMFPDIVDPVRMPSMFPIPSHLCKRQNVFTLDITNTGSIYGLFKPITVIPTNYNAGYVSAFSYSTTAPTVGNGDDPSVVGVNTQSNTTTVYTPSLTAVSGLVHGGARLIASFIEIEYVGTVEQHSGLIECGLHMHSVNSWNDMNIVHLYDQSEVVQAPFYKKFKPMDGIRCVWFPVDDNDFQFQDYDVSGASGIGEAASPGVVTLRQPVLPQWAINLTGLQNNQRVRVHICSYFETIVDEAFRDIYMVQRPKTTQSIPNVKAAVNSAVQNGMASTPSKTSSLWGNYYGQMREFMNGAKEAFGLLSDFAPAIGTLFGGGAGGAIGSGLQALGGYLGGKG